MEDWVHGNEESIQNTDFPAFSSFTYQGFTPKISDI